MSWFTSVGSYFSERIKEEQILYNYFKPMMDQVKIEALRLGKEDFEVGFKILTETALEAVTAAAVAPPGTQVAVAETTFLAVGAVKGIVAIKNAEQSAIKAAVAIMQAQESGQANAAYSANTVANTSINPTQ